MPTYTDAMNDQECTDPGCSILTALLECVSIYQLRKIPYV